MPRTAKKKASKKKAAKKRQPKKPAAKKRLAKKSSGGMGRPVGATTHVPVGLEVKETHDLSRSTSPDPVKDALRRITLITVDPDYARALYKLNSLVKKKDKGLLKLLGYKKTK